MADEIKPGDVVQLKSGGPKMTVARLETFSGKVMVVCDWFDGQKTDRNTFPVESLKRGE